MEALRTVGRSPVGLHLPGHGIIPAPRDPAHYADLATLLSEKLPAGVFDAVGFSLGAKLLLELATRSPGRIGRLVLGGVGDNVFAPEGVADMAARALESGATTETPGAVLEFLRRWEPARNDALAVAAVLRRPPNPTFTEERLRTVTTPVLVINGTEDPVAQRAARLLKSLPHARHHSISGVGHFDLPSSPEFLSAALTFLQEPNA
jgi:pimeloyl-ACP methyl ester carboxylesterase